ncbi:MAG: MFS transporter, partial [Marinobacter sp. 34-60-7]
SLLIPAIGIGFAVQDNTTAYPTMLILALLCGLGGGNFSSSMANISFFYPKKEKGKALGLNAGLGNLGVSAVQLLGPLVIASSVFGSLGGAPLQIVSGPNAGEPVWLQNAALLWVPFIVVVTLAAWFGMNDIASAKSSFADQAVIFRRKHNWLMCVLYMGTFGSFIGFAAGFPLLTGKLFPAIDVARYAFIGPLVGALARPLGGMLADKFGGARVTLVLFIIMVGGVLGVMAFLPGNDGTGGSFWGFFAMFQILFIASGAGNGSTFRMVPVMFLNLRRQALGPDRENEAMIEGNRESAAVLGFISAIAAYGGFFIPKSYGTSMALTGGVGMAFSMFIVFYVVCIALTWWYYARPTAPAPC